MPGRTGGPEKDSHDRRLGDRLFHLLLRLYPADFHDDYGDEMADLFQHQRRDAGRRGAFGLWLRTVLDLLLTAPARQWELLRRDLPVTVRGLARAPGFTLTVLLTLGLGIGANAALFSVVHTVLLRPLPYPEAEELVRLRSWDVDRDATAGVSSQDAADWAETEGLEGLALWNIGSSTLTGAGTARRVTVATVSPSLLSVLGVAPVLGRDFLEREGTPGADGVALVSHGFWLRLLSGRPVDDVDGLSIDGRPVEVLGVLPEGFGYPHPEVEVWRPLAVVGDSAGPRDGRWLQAVGRRAPGTSLVSLRTRLEGVAEALADRYPDTNADWSVRVETLREAAVGGARRPLLLLWAAVALVLLVAGVNLSSLLLARGVTRRRELAVRIALGARAGRLTRLLLTESLLLAGLGTGLAIVLTIAVGAWLPRLAPDLPRIDELAVDGQVLVFTASLAIVTTVAFALLPARMARRRALDTVAADRAVGAPEGRPWRALVVAEVAVTLVLVAMAGLAARSLDALLEVDPGFESGRLLTFRVEPSMTVDFNQEMEHALRDFESDRSRAAAFYGELLARLRAQPGVVAASAVNRRPLGSPGAWTTDLFLPGDPGTRRRPPVRWRPSMGGYTETLGAPLMAGRRLADRDRAGSAPVAVVTQALARAYWPDGEAMGQLFTHDPPEAPERVWYRVVGVIGDLHEDGLGEEPPPLALVPMEQARFGFFGDWGMDVVLRTDGPPADLVPAVRATVAEADPELPTFAVTTLEAEMTAQASQPRRVLWLAGAFAVLALGLSAAGIFGVLSYRVARRGRELGLRMALGADPARILRLLLVDGLMPTLLGVVLGSVLALAGGRWLSASLFGVEPSDPLALLAGAGVTLAVATFAIAVPASRAARIEPLEALRHS